MSDNWHGFEKMMFADVLTDKEKRTHRMNICKQCEKLAPVNFCSECNCFMPAKTWITSKSCTLSKW